MINTDKLPSPIDSDGFRIEHDTSAATANVVGVAPGVAISVTDWGGAETIRIEQDTSAATANVVGVAPGVAVVAGPEAEGLWLSDGTYVGLMAESVDSVLFVQDSTDSGAFALPDLRGATEIDSASGFAVEESAGIPTEYDSDPFVEPLSPAALDDMWVG